MAEDFDLVVSIEPAPTKNTPYTNGYGLYQGSFMGVTSKPFIYFSFNISALDQFDKKVANHANESVRSTPLGEPSELWITLPSAWSELSENGKKRARDGITQQISEVVPQMFEKIGL